MADQVVGDLAQVLGGQHRVGELLERLFVDLGDRVDGSVSEAATSVSQRESEVLQCVADHRANAQIGERLHISVRTVESHVSSLLRKLGVADRRALARYARSLAGDGAGAGHGPDVGAQALGGVATLAGLVTVAGPDDGRRAGCEAGRRR